MFANKKRKKNYPIQLLKLALLNYQPRKIVEKTETSMDNQLKSKLDKINLTAIKFSLFKKLGTLFRYVWVVSYRGGFSSNLSKEIHKNLKKKDLLTYV